MSDPISDTYIFPAAKLHRKRPTWITFMAEDTKTLNVTKIHLPLVMAISIICAIAGMLMGVAWTAATKATTLDRLSQQFDVMNTQISTLAVESGKTGTKVDNMSDQVKKMQSQIDRLEERR